MNKLRKFLVASVMGITVLSMSFVVAPSVDAAASAGDLIKMEGLSSVYYLGNDGKRYVFPNESTYFSWYADFSGVVTIPASELQSYPLGGNVTMRPGTTLVKITTDPSVYAVEPNGMLRKIQNESQAAALYGTNWNKRIVDLSDAFFTNYTIGSPLADGQIPVGSLVKNANNATVYYYDGSNYRAVASESALSANRLWMKYVLTVTNTLTSGGTALSAMETSLVNTAQNGGVGPVVTGSGLMVSVNASTPAAQNIPGGSSVEFLKINMTAANDGPVNVSSIKLTSYGLSDPMKVTDVTFYDNGVKIGNSRNVNSNREASFNFATPIYVAAGTTKTLTVKATIDAYTGTYALGIAAASDVVSSGATTSGSFPVQGNMMSAVQATGVGSISISAINSNNGYQASFGEDDVLLADFNLSVNSEDALLQSIRLYNEGTRDNNIVSNLEMFIDGVKVADGAYADRYATFTLNNYQVDKSDTVLVEVKGDVGITSANDTIKFNFRSNDSTNIVAIGKTHGFALAIPSSMTLATEVKLVTGDFTIDMDKAAVPAKEYKPDTDNVSLAKISLKSNGENATLLSIDTGFYITQAGNTATTTSYFENVELVDANGGIYDLDVTASTTVGTFNLKSNEEIFLTKGVAKVFTLRADILDSAPENTTFRATLMGSALDIEGETSGVKISDITPSSVSGSVITVKEASLSVVPVTLNGVSVVAGAQNIVVYRAMVEAGDADDVRIQSFALATSTASTAFTNSNITKLDIYLDGQLMGSLSNRIVNDTSITFSSLVNNIVPAGKEVALEVKATFASNLDSGTFTLKAGAVSARSVVGSKLVTVTPGATGSRIVTVASIGKLTVDMVTTDSKANKDSFLLAGSETEAGRYLGEVKFTTENEAVKVTKLTLNNVATSTSADIKSVKLVKADGTLVAEKTVKADGDAEFDALNVTFDADKSTSLFIVVVARGMNVAGDPTSTATASTTVAYKIATSSVEAVGASSNEDIEGGNLIVDTADSSKIATIVGSKLNSIANALVDGKLANGTRTIGEYTFVFENGANRDSSNEELKATLTDLIINIDKDASTTLANVNVYVKSDSSKKSSNVSVSGDKLTWDTAALASLTDLDGSVTLVIEATVSAVPERGWLETSVVLTGSNVTYNEHVVAGNILSSGDKVKGAYLAD